MCKRYQETFILGYNITIDESKVFFTGRNNIKFYIPMKPKKCGFKIHCLVDADSGFLYNCLFDPGKEHKDLIIFDETKKYAEPILLKLIDVLDKRQRNIYFDGWYSSIILMNKLTKKGFLNTK